MSPVPSAEAVSGVRAAPSVERRAHDRQPMARIAQGIVVLALAVALPFVLDSYWIFQLTMVMVYAVATIGLDIAFGRTGLLSLAQGAFFGLGAYAVALTQGDINPFVQLLLVIAIGVVAGIVVSVPTVRLSGLRLALVTFLFGTLFIWTIAHLGSLTGGTQGLPVNPLTIGGLSTLDPVQGYMIALVLATAATLISVQISRTQFSRRMLAARDSEVAARSVGVRLVHTRVYAFILSAVFGAVAGWLYAYVAGFVAPSSFDLFPSVYFVVAVILGGAGRTAGSWLGAAYIVLMPQLFTVIGQPNLFPFLGGVVLIVIALVLPGGLIDGVEQLWRFAVGRVRGSATTGSGRPAP